MVRFSILLVTALLLAACQPMTIAGKGPRQLFTPLMDQGGDMGMVNGQVVYCYQTLGKPDCYYEPQSGAAPNRMIGVQTYGGDMVSSPGMRGTAMPDGSVMPTQPAMTPLPTPPETLPQAAPVVTPQQMKAMPRSSALPETINHSTVEVKKKKRRAPKTFDGSDIVPSSSDWADKPVE